MLGKITKNIPIHSRWKLALRTLPLIIFIVLVKFGIHQLGYEFLSLNSLFTAIISANIFLIGFLLSGTLVDYKESEKLPGDLSASIEAMADEGSIIYENNKSTEAKNFLLKLLNFNEALISWLHKKEKTDKIMGALFDFNKDFLVFEKQTQANFIVRMKQEQNTIRKIVNRIHTIRETSFLATGYAISEIITFVLVAGLIFIKMDPFYESIFFVSFVSFILVYMIRFIKDLDNPFEYETKNSSIDEVSLKPLLDSKNRLNLICINANKEKSQK